MTPAGDAVGASPPLSAIDDVAARAATTKASRTLGILVLVYALLVATHEGEFWPFSIYPMFSKAKQTLHQVAVVDVSQEDHADLWRSYSRADLPGAPFSVKRYAVDAVDLAKYVRLTEVWDEGRRQGLMDYFHDALSERDVLILEVWGKLSDEGELDLVYQPILLLTEEGSQITPHTEFSGLKEAP